MKGQCVFYFAFNITQDLESGWKYKSVNCGFMAVELSEATGFGICLHDMAYLLRDAVARFSQIADLRNFEVCNHIFSERDYRYNKHITKQYSNGLASR